MNPASGKVVEDRTKVTEMLGILLIKNSQLTVHSMFHPQQHILKLGP
jgi:hypothetical protein